MQERRSHCASFVYFDTKTLTRFEYLKSNASRRRGGSAGAKLQSDTEPFYLGMLPISMNTVLTFVPTVWTAGIMKTAINDAISAYSIAVAPELLTAKFFHRLEHWSLLL
jgi:hypothetical protein